MPRPSLNRSVTEREAEVVLWMLQHASLTGSLSHLEGGVRELHVVWTCECGCPSVDFARVEEPSGKAQVVADATGTMPDGIEALLLLWGTTVRSSGWRSAATAMTP
jgi:hypothetical protein